MSLIEVSDRIKACCPSLKDVGLLTDLEDIGSNLPAAFLYWGGDSGEGLDGVSAQVLQTISRSLTVLVAAPLDNSRIDHLELARDEVKNALSGFEFGENYRLEFSSGEPDSFYGATVRWRDVYSFTQYVRPSV